MIISKLNDNYIIKIHKFDDYKINIYDLDEVHILIKSIIKNIVKNNNLLGRYQVNIYINDIYGMIIEFNKLADNNYIDLKINFYIDSIFLYEIDTNYIDRDNTIYYYKDKYYILPKEENINLLESGNIIYGKEVYNIMNKGIRLILS